MPGKSSKSQVVSIRLSNATIERIERYLLSPRNPYVSVGDYCKNVVEREVWKKH